MALESFFLSEKGKDLLVCGKLTLERNSFVFSDLRDLEFARDLMVPY